MAPRPLFRPCSACRAALTVVAGIGPLAALAAAQPPGAAPSQQPGQQGQGPGQQEPGGRRSGVQSLDEGKIVRRVRFPGARSPETLGRRLTTQVRRPLSAAEVHDDLQVLWRSARILCRGVYVDDAEPDGVVVTFVVEEQRSYDRTAFRGLRHFSEVQVREIINLTVAERVTDTQAREYKAVLEERYRADGYLYARVQIEPDEETSTLTMNVDEGPEVTVRNVHFRGNRAFPGSAPLDLYRSLIGSAEIESRPAGKILPGKPYSEEAVQDDLDRLRTFYRGAGFRDAEVWLAKQAPSEDLTSVDLTFRVIEGPRYRIRSVDLEYVEDGELKDEPLYPKDDLLAELKAKPGQYYDRELIVRDKRAIEDFYGQRGHPLNGKYGRAEIKRAFAWVGAPWMQPQETFDTEEAEIDLVYQVIEGTPKTVRDVRISGNTDTQDRVVRRQVYVFPGELLDLRELERSRRRLDALRYFQDSAQPRPAQFELLPVDEDSDVVDVDVQVEEGDTGSFLWGAGVSTGAGVQGRFQFTKRNFDLFRLPSSWAPGTVISEIIDSKAFHGGGQSLELFLAPGTEISTFQISLNEPDLFGNHIDTIGGTVQGYRRIRRLDSFDSDALGIIVGLQRNFTDTFQLGFRLRQETVDIEDVDGNAPTIVFDAEGQNELRSFSLSARLRDVDNPLRPSDGHDVLATAELAGGLLGADEDFYKLGLWARWYYPLWRDSADRAHVFHVSQRFDFGHAYSNTDDLFLTERWYMGGSTLRGFDQRDAGPTQFGRPLGGEVRYLSRVEYQFPLVSTRQDGSLREVELLRGVVFSDAGLLGTAIDDPTFREPRLSVGVGVRIHVPVLGLPIALDYGFPILYEETDDRRGLYFSLQP